MSQITDAVRGKVRSTLASVPVGKAHSWDAVTFLSNSCSCCFVIFVVYLLSLHVGVYLSYARTIVGSWLTILGLFLSLRSAR